MDQKIFFPFRRWTAFSPFGCIIYYLCKNEQYAFGSHSTWNIYSMTASLAYCCICGYLFLMHCFCPFSCLLPSVVMKTDIKFLNTKEVMEKVMVRTIFQRNVRWRNRSRVSVEGNQKQPLQAKGLQSQRENPYGCIKHFYVRRSLAHCPPNI